MCYVVKEMGDEVPETFFWHYIFLATNLAVFASHHCVTVKAIFFFSFFKVRHGSCFGGFVKKAKKWA